MNCQLYICILLLAILAARPAEAQRQDLQFKVYGFEEGLTHRNVYKIHQDQLGFIWIATYKGLNRFDGKEFTPFLSGMNGQELLDDFVEDLLISSDTLIWMSGKGFISVLDPLTNNIKAIETDSSSTFWKKEQHPLGLYLDSQNRIWTATYGLQNGMAALQNINWDGRLQDVIQLEDSPTNLAMASRDDHLFFSYAMNTVRELDVNGSWVRDYRLQGGAEAWVAQLQRTEDGTLWALLLDGRVYALAPGATKFTPHPMSKQTFNSTTIYNGFFVEDNGDIWLGGRNELWLYEQEKKRAYNYNAEVKKLTKNSCNYRQIMKDASGVIWIASDYGAIRVAQSDHLFTTYLNEGDENCGDDICSMRGITEDEKGNIYLSYYNSIHVLDMGSNTLRPLFFPNFFNNPPFGLHYAEGSLWTGSGRCIDLSTLKVDTLFNPAGGEGVVTQDRRGQIWFADQNRLYYCSPQQKVLRPYRDPKGVLDSIGNITFIHPVRNSDRFWLATQADGLLLLDPTEGCMAQYTSDPTSQPRISHNRILGLYEAADGILWIASENGVNKLNLKSQQNRVYTDRHGLPNSFINGLLPEGDSCMWFSTDNGLSRMHIARERFDNFTTRDGLTKNEFNRMSFYKARDGRMYFGGLNGINAFYPSRRFLDRQRNQRDKLVWSAFSKLDGRYDSIISDFAGLHDRKSIQLGYRDKFFTFKFALANYNNPQQNQYSYKLEGYETEWSQPSTQSFARYSNIPAGTYTFRVRAAADNGNWSKEQLAIRVVIEEAFYRSWWFVMLCVLFLSAALYTVQQYRIRRIRQRQQELERLVKERTQELVLEKKKSEDLLHNILPQETAKELMLFGKAKAKLHDSVTVFFSDIKDFSRIAENMDPEELVAEIDTCFKAFDEIIDLYGLEKIKTIGDAYMCAGGIPTDNSANATQVVQAALEIQSFMEAIALEHRDRGKPYFEVRIGIHTGPVVSGIVGIKKFAYDIWGDTVNIASRMETNSEAGKVNISQSTYELVKEEFACSHRGKITAKNMGEIDMYFVEGIKE
ncbi:MAG: adenylate/guanylate cyclase domain-containing protein [Bacteroidota bacterium]